MELTYNLRDYNINDYKQVEKLWLEIGLGSSARGDNQDVIQKTLENGGKLFVLEEKILKLIIGTSWITNDNRRLYLHHFGIKTEFQNKGLSKILLQKSLEFAKSTGLQIKLEVHENNVKATNLYEKYGFSYLGDYNVFIIRDYKTINEC